jgi:hypothetical protein
MSDFWRSMDTFPDRQIVEDMIEQGNMPAHLFRCSGQAGGSPAPISLARRRRTV